MKEIILLIYLFFYTPSESDLILFLEKDKTNEIPYSDNFDCKDFTETLIGNSFIKAYPVGVGWDNGDGVVYHVFVTFETKDGIFWVEPQNDRFYDVSDSGLPLCYSDGECVTDKLLFVYTSP